MIFPFLVPAGWYCGNVISVCIPVHIVHPSQLDFLKEAIHSVLQQKGVYFEICISDDTQDSRVAEISEFYSEQGIEIRYVKAEFGIGLAANINSSISMARGDLVKILFQDDYLHNPKVLRNNARRLKHSRAKWLVTGTIHLNQVNGSFDKPLIPRINQHFLDGKNSFSSPSVVMFKRRYYLPFDTRLNYLVDCEWYVRMLHNYGKPTIKKSIDIVNRLHENQATHEFKDLLSREISLAKQAHSTQVSSKEECLCVTKSVNLTQIES